MILRIEKLQDACNKILPAVDYAGTAMSEKLQLSTIGNRLYVSGRSTDYFVKVAIDNDDSVDFFATVNANKFLKLISQTTSESVELIVNDKNLIVKGNGEYKIPIDYVDDEMIRMPEIEINNVSNEFIVSSEILNSIATFNSRTVAKEGTNNILRTMYYMDELGCITYTQDACVNSFKLDSPIKVLMPAKLVKLFKLFKEGDVRLKIGHDAISNDIIQTKIAFENDFVSITYILSCDDSLIGKFPASAIRNSANAVYPYSVALNRNEVIAMINRLSIFATNVQNPNMCYGIFEFGSGSVTVYDTNRINKETIYYEGDDINVQGIVSVMLNLNEFKSSVESCNDQNISISFGDGKAIVVTRGSIRNVIPESNFR